MAESTTTRRIWLVWLLAFIAFMALVWLLRSVLLPFAAGLGLAYFLDPLCDRLERLGCSRTLATSLVTAAIALLIVLFLLVVTPLLAKQIGALILSLPDFLAGAQARLLPLYERLQIRWHLPPLTDVGELMRTGVAAGLGFVGQTLQQLVSGGAALVSVLSLIFITPVVAFYLLRDWDRIVARLDGLLPRDYAPTIRQQARLIDISLAGFVRGQALVCLCLAGFYAVALGLAGLPFGVLIGLAAGFFSFIPYVGSLTGFFVSLAIALATFSDWRHVAVIVGIFGIGQVLEGNFLTPKLVGDRIGLHPVWIILALLAFGALFGFLGLLIAVPAAAALGVLARFVVGRYLSSHLYLGHRQGKASDQK